VTQYSPGESGSAGKSALVSMRTMLLMIGLSAVFNNAT
jgi:hypothetical protein